MRTPFVAGNWKMNGSKDSVKSLIDGILSGISTVSNAEVAVCPPFVYLPEVAQLLEGSNIAWGSQNIAKEEAGAYTGEISASMLNDFACKYAIVGHSERRTLYGETDQVVAEKFAAAQKGGLIPILCIGETLEERESNVTEQVVERQMAAVVSACGIKSLLNSVIAYEPVWAIGTGKTASPEQAQEVHAFIRAWLAKQDSNVANAVRVLYGGSVNAENAETLFSQSDIDGGLIGGASLKADDFLTIC
ncbi:MAG: triose-phosphate isomerase, partial [Gammaproteobacteria bacterium]|nr:triose-phosphate isomerase [Gammaproteobacteria bacterium]